MLLRENAPLREYCSMRVGGPARLAAFPETAEELAALLRAGGVYARLWDAQQALENYAKEGAAL